MRLTLLTTLLILLTGCSSTTVTPTPKVVTEYETIQADIPSELLRCEKAPNPYILKEVSFLAGRESAKIYTKELVLTNYKNCQKIQAIKELVKP